MLDKLAIVAGGCATVASGVARQVRNEARERALSLLTQADLVPREDFERLEMAFESALKRLKDLESRLESLENPPTKKRKNGTQ